MLTVGRRASASRAKNGCLWFGCTCSLHLKVACPLLRVVRKMFMFGGVGCVLSKSELAAAYNYLN